jgi:hypothetical protein
VQLRQAAALNADLAQRLADLEHKTELIAMSHDTFSSQTRAQLKQVLDVLRELTAPPLAPVPSKRPIGFITPQDKV